MVKYKREILSIYVAPKKDDLLNVVSRVTWRWTAIEDFTAADIYVDTVFSTIDPNNFIDYSDLTDVIVFNWIDSVEDLNKLQQDLNTKLTEAKNPMMVEKSIPWSSEERYTGLEEYLLVMDDSLHIPNKVLGPTKWDSNRANIFLSQNGVTNFEFPDNIMMYKNKILPVDSALIVGDRIKLYRVEDSSPPIIDKNFKYIKKIEWDVSTGKAVSEYMIENLEIDQIKENLNNLLSRVSSAKQYDVIDYDYNDQTIALTAAMDIRFNLTQRWLLMSDTNFIDEKIGDLWITLSKEDIKNMLDTIESHVAGILQWEKNKHDQIMSCTTVQQLEAIGI